MSQLLLRAQCGGASIIRKLPELSCHFGECCQMSRRLRQTDEQATEAGLFNHTSQIKRTHSAHCKISRNLVHLIPQVPQ
eukprot:6264325-Amphidinium_carterae.1